jgi:hypothetical protein
LGDRADHEAGRLDGGGGLVNGVADDVACDQDAEYRKPTGTFEYRALFGTANTVTALWPCQT